MTGESIRAVRNNNPGNIKIGDPWQGLMPRHLMTPDQANEQVFCVFKSPVWGFRALARNLITYQDSRRAADGSVIDTVVEAITRWAPPSENDTEKYIQRVCKITDFSPNQVLDFHEYEDLAPIAKAISIVECGGWFFDDEDLDAGLASAGVPKGSDKLVESRTIKAATVAGAVTSISIVSDVVTDVVPVTNLIREIAEYAPTVAGVLVLIALMFIIYARYDDWKRARG